jgi:NAD(P)-dependent dehydrogenase (short-subunit alcohol dehydrogenase family)
MASTANYAAVHANPNGPGDARPTAMAIVEDQGMVGKLGDKVFLITGCTSGIGLETARALHATGAHIFITARDMQKGVHVRKELLAGGPPGHGKIDVLELELDSFKSVRACAAKFLEKSRNLNVLINNAGWW